MVRFKTSCLTVWLNCLFSLIVVAQGTQVELGDVREEHVMIPMRDGVRLSAYLYFPSGTGPWPVLYEQRYADLTGKGTREANARLAAAGYVVCAENFRGSQKSEGTWNGYRNLGWGELQDGYDTVEWLAKQSWSTGKIGTFGSSQAGFAQNFLAVAAPPHLVAQYMIDTGLSLFHEGYRIGGITRPQRFKAMADVCRNPLDNSKVMDEWNRHPAFDEYWAAEDCSQHFARMNVPCFTIGSWYDFMNVGSIDSYVGRQHHGGPSSRGRQQLRIGPWLHGGYLGKNSAKVNELTYPENSRFDAEKHLIRWFDHHLKGIPNGVDREVAVQYYTMGPVGEPHAPGNEWRVASDWPLPAQATAYYLHGDRSLSINTPDEPVNGKLGSTSFLADPHQPNEIPGRGFPGAMDARSFESQKEVRTFTSEVLSAPVEWTGKVSAELFVSSSAKDTDFIVRVSDVYPDGRSILIIDYVRRARFREGFDKQVFMEPGKIYKVAFDVGWLSQIFATGHRIRVTIASTGAPFFEPNSNTGGEFTNDLPADAVVAKNQVHHNLEHASKVIAPLVVNPRL